MAENMDESKSPAAVGQDRRSGLEGGKPTAVIDYSFFRAVCSEPASIQMEFWNSILNRYELIIPFALVGEVWKDLAHPGEIEQSVLCAMASAMYQMHLSWIDDPLSISFKELVLKQPIHTFPSPPQYIKDFLFSLDDEDPKLIEFLAVRRAAKEAEVNEIIAAQDDCLPQKEFCYVDSLTAFFQKYIGKAFAEILKEPTRTSELLEKHLGQAFRKRFPDHAKAITSAFGGYNGTTFTRYPITLNNLMAAMFYFNAPLFRIGKRDQRDPRKIIGRSFHDQINNDEDKQYVISGLMCNRLLTCDKGMANVMSAFQECGLWEGQAIHINRLNLRAEIPGKLI